ncbi:hypothetical protein Har1130_01270 [Haloarcula sp. CBA1130]|uniref:DUF7544 domain-containing protein n=1 Tax=unclassified Haloarcula TaxID=2624677 RepID=UPI0012494889|nr:MULTISPECIES: hypothetical protein [unclassified Haloarcula]KAA9399739.1 hypothetical protein Har1129_16545 [Haloarcula sp. CBA1129]KAA9401435.1 hypothetical protein Har1130_01270 [Haloarcula sp. CBA1130]
MALHAVDDIDDAIDATKSFLFPFEKWMWLRMAFVVFFIGGGGVGLNNAQSFGNFSDFGGNGGPSGPSGPGGEFQLAAPLESVASLPGNLALQVSEPGVPSGAPDELLAGAGLLVFAVIGLFVLLALAYGIVSNFMEFVLTQALIDREIHVRQYFSEHVGNGIRLFLFRLALVGIWLGVAVLIGAAVFFLALGGEAANVGASSVLALSGLVIAVFAVFAISYGVVFGFTTVFVVPLMAADNDGVLSGWSRLWGSIKSEPKQYLAYLFFSIVLQIGVGIVGAILGIIAFIVVAIPVGLGAFALYLALQNTIGIALAVVLGLLGGLVFLVLSTLIQVPLTTFLRYYAMLVLGDIDDDMDPIPEVRSDIRSE